MTDGDTNSGGGSAIHFSEGESKLLIGIMKHLTSDIQFNADALAKEMGYKDGGVVKVRWGQIKRKHFAAGGASPGSVKKRTPKKTPVKASGDEGDDEAPATPTKTPGKKRGRKPKVEEDADEIKMGEADEGNVVESTE